METTVKQRLTEFIKYKGFSVRKFERDCGLSNGYVNSIEQTIMPNKVKAINLQFPDLNTGWLLTGEGEMLKDETPIDIAPLGVVPLLPIAAQGGTLTEFTMSVMNSDCEKVISPIKGAELAITVNGDSMMPEYPNGSQVFVKKIDARIFIEWGKAYVLDTYNGVILKKIMPSEHEGCVKCVSVNPDYPAFEISLKDINGMYRVLLSMSIK